MFVPWPLKAPSPALRKSSAFPSRRFCSISERYKARLDFHRLKGEYPSELRRDICISRLGDKCLTWNIRG